MSGLIENAIKAWLDQEGNTQPKPLKLLDDDSLFFIEWFRKNKQISNHGSRIKLDTVLNKLIACLAKSGRSDLSFKNFTPFPA